MEQREIPHDTGLEQSVLGCLLVHPEHVSRILVELRPTHFYGLRERILFEAIARVLEDRGVISPDLIRRDLQAREHKSHKDSSEWDEIGGHVYLAHLADIHVPPSTAIIHADELRSIAQERMAVRLGRQLAEGCITSQEAIQALAEIDEQTRASTYENSRTDARKHWEAIKDPDEKIPGVKTGLRELDVMIGGLRPPELCVLAAGTGIGKTSLALNIARNVAKSGGRVLIFSLEMGAREIWSHFISTEGRIHSKAIRDKVFANLDIERGDAALCALEHMDIGLDMPPELTPGLLRAKCRTHFQAGKIDLIVIDYLQLMTVHGNNENRQVEVATISRSLKAMAREMHVPVLALCQLNRGPEVQERKPRLHDLRESGAIAHDADCVLILHRDRRVHAGPSTLDVAKQRSGPVGEITLLWDGDFYHFDDVPPVEEREGEPLGWEPPTPPRHSPRGHSATQPGSTPLPPAGS